MDAGLASVLVVEDEPDHARLLRTLLAMLGLLVIVAADLATARAALAESPGPDLVVLDLVLPDGDGLALCREVKARSPTVPVVVVSAWLAPSTRAETLAAGADAFLVKPFDLDEFAALVRALVPLGPGSSAA